MEPDVIWRIPSKDLTLGPDDVDIWWASLDLPHAESDRLSHVLSQDERETAARRFRDRERRRFIAGRGRLRSMLGTYLRLPPDQIRFRYGPQGKPLLERSALSADLRFSLSHSQDFALFAFSVGREVGIDVEGIRPLAAAQQIADRFFSASESEELRSLPQPMRQEAFFRCWTRKEAHLKARGQGLAASLARVVVSLKPAEPARVLSIVGEPGEETRWSLVDLSPRAGYVGALAVEGNSWRLRRWEWVEPSP